MIMNTRLRKIKNWFEKFKNKEKFEPQHIYCNCELQIKIYCCVSVYSAL